MGNFFCFWWDKTTSKQLACSMLILDNNCQIICWLIPIIFLATVRYPQDVSPTHTSSTMNAFRGALDKTLTSLESLSHPPPTWCSRQSPSDWTFYPYKMILSRSFRKQYSKRQNKLSLGGRGLSRLWLSPYKRKWESAVNTKLNSWVPSGTATDLEGWMEGVRRRLKEEDICTHMAWQPTPTHTCLRIPWTGSLRPQSIE